MNPIQAPTRLPDRTGRDVARALAAAGALLAFIVGVPLVLTTVAPVRLPRSWPTWDSVTTAVMRADDGSLLLAVVTVAAWGAWAAFTLSVLVEVAASLRGVRAPSLPLLGRAQHAAASLITTAGLLLSTSAPVIGAPLSPPVTAAAPHHLDDRQPTATSPTAHLTGTRGQPVTGTGAAMTGTPGAMTATPLPVTAPADPSASSPEAPVEADRYPGVTVERGDTLWSLAERHLGTGHRFAEIRDLNLHRPQPDGATFTDGDWIYPGWQLRLPPDATNLPAPAAATPHPAAPVIHEVVPGDTLWEIAEAHLGDGDQYAQIAHLNTGVVQRDGETLIDPDLIRPGWRLAIPAPAPAGSAPGEPGPAPAGPTPDAAPLAPGAGAPVPVIPHRTDDELAPEADSGPLRDHVTEKPVDQVAGEEDIDDADDQALPAIQVFLGLTGLAAAGVIGELARRRHLQHRGRRTGERIPLPPPGSPAAHAEQTLRSAATPLTIAQLKSALLNLASRVYAAERDLPRIALMHLGDDTLQLDLLDDDPDAIEPFTATGPRRWTAPTALIAADPLIEDDSGRPEPYPALVTLGHTDAATVIANLEATGTLKLTGDPEPVRDVVRALVAELVTSDLTGRVGLIAGPEFAELAAASDPARLQCPPPGSPATEHATRTRAVAKVLAAAGVEDTLQARSDRVAPDTWLPVIYVDNSSTPSEAPERWSGTVLITGDARAEGWTLVVGPQGAATLEPAGVDLDPPRLSEQDLRHLIALLTIAQPPDDTSAPAEPAALTQDTSDALQAMPAPELPAGPSPDQRARSAVRINVLGRVEIHGVTPDTRPLGRRSTELLVYLALRGKATGPELDDVLWPGQRVENKTRNSLIYRTRQRVGADNLPPVDAAGHYRLGPDVTSDWSDFQHLARQGLAADLDETDQLRAAMQLLRDRPFTGAGAAEFTWAEHDMQQMIEAIVDTAHVLSGRLLAAGDHRGALAVAVHGLVAEPCSEQLYDDAIRAAHERGDAHEAERLLERMHAQLASLDPDYAY